MDDIGSFAGAGRAPELFGKPQKYRDMVLASLRPCPQDWAGRSYVVVFPTKFCPVGCAHCYFASPKPTAQHTFESVLSEQDLQLVTHFLEEARTEFLQITGGGEPLLELDSLLWLVENSHADRIDINTSGVSLVAPGRAAAVIETIFAASCRRPRRGVFNFRVSVDEFHLAQIGTKSLRTILAVFRGNYRRYAEQGFVLKLHTLYRDEAVPQFLAALAEELERVEYEDQYGFRVPIKMCFRDGTAFEIDHAARMFANAAPDLSRHEEVDRAVERYDRIRVNVRTPGIFVDSAGAKGLCLVIHEDGAVELWNTTPKDTIGNIRTHSFAQIRRSILSDVIQVAALEKTRLYIDALLEEINPLASRRAKAIGSATLFNRRAFSEARDRLYVSIRAMQDYIAEGMGERFDLQALDPLLQAALRLPQEQLRELYLQSRHDIVEEHLRDPQLTVEQLVQLHRALALGHYPIAPQTLIERVSRSGTLVPQVGRKFLDLVRV